MKIGLSLGLARPGIPAVDQAAALLAERVYSASDPVNLNSGAVQIPTQLSGVTATTGAATVLVRMSTAGTVLNGRVFSATNVANRGFEIMAQQSPARALIRVGGTTTFLNVNRNYVLGGSPELVGFTVSAGALVPYTTSAGAGAPVDITGIGTFSTDPTWLFGPAWTTPTASNSYDGVALSVSVWDRALDSGELALAESGLNT